MAELIQDSNQQLLGKYIHKAVTLSLWNITSTSNHQITRDGKNTSLRKATNGRKNKYYELLDRRSQYTKCVCQELLSSRHVKLSRGFKIRYRDK